MDFKLIIVNQYWFINFSKCTILKDVNGETWYKGIWDFFVLPL